MNISLIKYSNYEMKNILWILPKTIFHTTSVGKHVSIEHSGINALCD